MSFSRFIKKSCTTLKLQAISVFRPKAGFKKLDKTSDSGISYRSCLEIQPKVPVPVHDQTPAEDVNIEPPSLEIEMKETGYISEPVLSPPVAHKPRIIRNLPNATIEKLPTELLLDVCELLPILDFLRLQEVSSRFKDVISSSVRARKFLSRRHTFLWSVSLDRLVEFSTNSVNAKLVTHLTLDMASPRFRFDTERFRRNNYGRKLHEISNGSADDLGCTALDVPQELINYNPYCSFHLNNSKVCESLETAFRNLPNLRYIRFAKRRIKKISDYSSPEGQQLLSIWEDNNPVLKSIPDWKGRFLGHNSDVDRRKGSVRSIIQFFNLMDHDTTADSIYGDILKTAVQAGVQLRGIEVARQMVMVGYSRIQDLGVFSEYFTKEGLNDLDNWAPKLARTFSNLESLGLVFHCMCTPSFNLDTSETPRAALYGTRELIITDMQHSSTCTKPDFSSHLSQEMVLPKLRTLRINDGSENTLSWLQKFLLANKVTIKELEFRSKCFSWPGFQLNKVIHFLQFLKSNLSLEEMSVTFSIPRSGAMTGFGFSRIGLKAYGNWSTDGARPFVLAYSPQHAYNSQDFVRQLMTNDRIGWDEMIHKMTSCSMNRQTV